MPEIPVFNHDAVLSAVAPEEAIERVRHAFVEYASGEWTMPPKVYLDAYPAGDFRAMPAKGAGVAILKWVTSFPGNPSAGLPVVMGVICVSSATDGEPLALIDARSITALRTGAVSAVAAQELGPEDARSVGIVGCGFNGAWSARCLAAAEFGPGVCFDRDPEVACSLAGELGWEAGSREARTPRERVRTRTMARAMKISPSVRAASVTWLAMAQVTTGVWNQCPRP